MHEIHGEVSQLQSAVADSRVVIEELRRSLQSVGGKIDDLSANMENRFQSVTEEIRAIVRRFSDGGVGAGQTLQYIVDEEAKKFWADYFPRDDDVLWADFQKALRTEHDGLGDAALKLLQQDLDINNDGKVHVREFNIFTKKFGLAGAVRRFAAASKSEDADGKTALYRAAREDNVCEVRRLLATKADPNFRQRYRRTTPLHAAAYYGFEKVAEALLLAGARADVLNEFELTALQEATNGNHTAIAEFIRISTMRGRDRAALAAEVSRRRPPSLFRHPPPLVARLSRSTSLPPPCLCVYYLYVSHGGRESVPPSAKPPLGPLPRLSPPPHPLRPNPTFPLRRITPLPLP